MSETFPIQPSTGGGPAGGALIDAELLSALLDYVADGVCLLDRNNQIVYWNHGAEQITGHLVQEVAGRPCSEDLAFGDPVGTESGDAASRLARVREDGKSRSSLIYMRHRQGHRIPVRIHAHAILDAGGQVTGVAEVFARASAQGRTELAEAARHLGHDGLTGAVTRAYGETRLMQELEVMERFGLATAWMRVEVDSIDELKRRFGHGMADAALRMIANTIDANLKSFDALIRWDEGSFRVMVRHAVEDRLQELAASIELLVRTSRVEWWGEGRGVSVSAAGVMVVPQDTATSLEQRVGLAFESRRGRAAQENCSG